MKGQFIVSVSDQWLGSDLAIYNAAGKLVLNTPATNSIIEIHLTQPAGAYRVKITKNSKSLMPQIILRSK